MNCMLIDVKKLIWEWGDRICTESIKQDGNDRTLVAMIVAKKLKQQLDPTKLFEPKKRDTASKETRAKGDDTQ